MWIANGTGLAPFLSMARAGLSAGKKLLHGARASEDFYFADELAAFLESESWDPALSYELCGSASMVVEVRDLLIEKGIPHRSIVSEVYF